MDTYEKMLLASLGILSVSVKEAKQLLKTISEKKISSKEWEKFIAFFVKMGKIQQVEASKITKSIFKNFLKELDVPTKDDLQKLEKRINALTKK